MINRYFRKMEKKRKCPYCGEEIMADARKCKHCGEWLNDEAEPKQDPIQGTEKKELENQSRNEVLATTAVVKEPLEDSVPIEPKESLFKSCFWEQITKHYCDFKGNVDRKTFWICYLYYSLIMLVTAGISAIAPLFGTILTIVVSLGLLLPFLGLMVRRLHDVGKKGAWILVSLVPLVGVIWLLVLLAKKGETQSSNKWSGKDTIITIAMVIAGIGLYVLGLSGIASSLDDGIIGKDNRQEIGMNNTENEIKAEIERQVLAAYNNGTISELVTPEFRSAEDVAMKAQDQTGDIFFDADEFYKTQDDRPDVIRISEVKLLSDNVAFVEVMLDWTNNDYQQSVGLMMVPSNTSSNLKNAKWLVDDIVSFYMNGEEVVISSSYKAAMIEYANDVIDYFAYNEEVDKDSFDDEIEDEAALNLNNVDYEDYYNSRFDFSVLYPSFFKRKYEAANQDGCEFEYGNNYSMRVYGMNNVLEKTIKELFKDSKKSTDTYSTSKDNWFVVSGVNEQGNIYYRKTILDNDVEYVVELVYPQTKKTEYDVVVKKVIGSFQVLGSEEEGGNKYVVIDGSELRLRLGPSTSSETLKWGDGSNRHPEVGEKFRLLDESSDFYKIDYKGNEVWVSKQFSHIEIQ